VLEHDVRVLTDRVTDRAAHLLPPLGPLQQRVVTVEDLLAVDDGVAAE
jgi:hypothetical protein